MANKEHLTLTKPILEQNVGSIDSDKVGKSLTNPVAKLYAVSDILALSLVFFAISFALNAINVLSFLVVSAGIMLWFERNGHYRVRMPLWLEIKSIFSTVILALLVDSFVGLQYFTEISRLYVLASWGVVAFAIIGFRFLVRIIAAKNGNFSVPTLLIGSGDTAKNAQMAVESAPEMGYKIVAQIKNLPEVFLQYGSSWDAICEAYSVKHVIIALEGKDYQGTERVIAKLMRKTIPFSVVPPLTNLPVTNIVPQYFMNHNTMLLTHDSANNQYLPQFAKRAFDIAVSSLALLVLSPLMLIIAACIKLDGGDAMFGHKRLGRNGKVFPCLKFRSMIMNGDKILREHLEKNPEAAAEWKATQKLQNDPRVTRIGKFLRSTSLDEIPQLVNVLKGDMSLVGPRPIVRDEVAHYSHDIAYYYMVRPGVTGLWQVSGRSDVSYSQRVQMDSWYVRNWSLWHDMCIILKTFPAVFKRSGAY